MEVLNLEQRYTGSSSSEISLNTNDILKDLAIEFGENSDDVESSSSVLSLLGESFSVQRDVYKNNTIIKSDQQSVISAAPPNCKLELAGASDFDNDGTDSEICEINSKGKYSTIKDALYVPPKYLIPPAGVQDPSQNSATDATRIIHTQGKVSVTNSNNKHLNPIADSGKTSCSSFSSDEACDPSLLTYPSSTRVRSSSNKSWTTSSSSLEGDIESFVDEELGEESDSDIDTNRTVTKMTHSAFSTSCNVLYQSTFHSSTTNLHNKADTCRTVNMVTPTKLQKSEYYSPTSSSSEASLVDVKSRMIQHLAQKLSCDKADVTENLNKADVKKPDENETSFLTRKLNLLRFRPAAEIKTLKVSRASEDGVCAAEQDEVVPTTWIDLLQVKTLQAKLEALATGPMHDPNKCVSCREATDIVEQKTVLRSLLLRAQRPLIQEKIDHHLVMNNSISLIGELARSLQKPSIAKKLAN